MGAARAGIVTAACALAVACGLDVVGAKPDGGVVAGGDASSSSSSSGGSSSGGSSGNGDAASDAPFDASEGGGSSGSSVSVGSMSNPGSSITVTTDGTLDWFVWGPDGITTPIRRNGANAFSAFAASGSDIGTADLSFPLQATWSGGTPAPASGTSGVHAYAGNGTGAKLEFDVAASTTTRTLGLYLGAFDGNCTLSLALSDASASGNASFSGPAAGFTIGRYLVTFSAASAGVKLHVAWTTTGSSATYCDVLAGTLN